MASLSSLSYSVRADKHHHPLVKRLFSLAESKKSNIVLSADVETTRELLSLVDGKWSPATSKTTSFEDVGRFFAFVVYRNNILPLQHSDHSSLS